MTSEVQIFTRAFVRECFALVQQGFLWKRSNNELFAKNVFAILGGPKTLKHPSKIATRFSLAVQLRTWFLAGSFRWERVCSSRPRGWKMLNFLVMWSDFLLLPAFRRKRGRMTGIDLIPTKSIAGKSIVAVAHHYSWDTGAENVRKWQKYHFDGQNAESFRSMSITPTKSVNSSQSIVVVETGILRRNRHRKRQILPEICVSETFFRIYVKNCSRV